MEDDTATRRATKFAAGIVDGDAGRMRSALRDDVTWSVPGQTAISGVARGADAVIERARAIYASGVKIAFEGVLHGLDKVAVELHNSGRQDDVVLDEKVVIVSTLRDGRITAADNLISDVEGLTAFFAAGER